MFTILFNRVGEINRYYDENQHPATAKLFFSRWTLFDMTALSALYLLLVTQAIPYFMRNRKPLVLKWSLFAFDSIMAIANLFFFLFSVQAVFKRNGPVSVDSSEMFFPQGYDPFVYCIFANFLSKFFDWIDSVFFALRKRHSHLSFLHLYHHAIVPVIAHFFIRTDPLLPCVKLFVVCNSFVHTFMYSYYALSTLGPTVRKYLGWKKYITQLQLFQFVVYLAYLAKFIFDNADALPQWAYLMFSQSSLFLYLFYKFYKRSYK